jgi:hypothetical protein
MMAIHRGADGEVLDVRERQRGIFGLSSDTWRVIGYVRDVLIIFVIMFGAMYFYEHPEAFDALLYWSIGHYYRH